MAIPQYIALPPFFEKSTYGQLSVSRKIEKRDHPVHANWQCSLLITLFC
jgi:hypothetical protein